MKTRYWCRKRALFAVSFPLLLAIGSPSNAENATDYLERLTKQMPRGVENTPAQWFEKYGLLGWEKMMLIFGYADNFTVCMHLIEMAKSDSPDDYFRYGDAN